MFLRIANFRDCRIKLENNTRKISGIFSKYVKKIKNTLYIKICRVQLKQYLEGNTCYVKIFERFKVNDLKCLLKL